MSSLIMPILLCKKKKINFSDNKIEIHKVKKVTDLEQIVAMLINSIKIKRQNKTQETT